MWAVAVTAVVRVAVLTAVPKVDEMLAATVMVAVDMRATVRAQAAAVQVAAMVAAMVMGWEAAAVTVAAKAEQVVVHVMAVASTRTRPSKSCDGLQCLSPSLRVY